MVVVVARVVTRVVTSAVAHVLTDVVVSVVEVAVGAETDCPITVSKSSQNAAL